MDKVYQYKTPPTQPSTPSQGPRLFSLPHKYLAVLIIALCLISIGLAILLLSDHTKRDNILVNLVRGNILRFPPPTPTPEHILSGIEETLGWNTYSSSEFAYSIKYPIDWGVSLVPQEDPKILEYVIFNPLSATQSGQLSVTITYTTRPYEEILDADPQPGESVIIASVGGTRKLKQDSARNVFISIALPYDPNTFVFVAEEKYKEIFNKMLSTFQFPQEERVE